MAKLKIPSLQHLARVWHPDPVRIQKALVALVRNSPTFSYELVFELVRDLIYLKIPYSQIEQAIIERVKREDVRKNFLSLLPLVQQHFKGVEISFVHQVARRFYPVGRELVIPFSPPLIYGSNGKLHLPWFSFWRSNPLDKERLALFITVIDDIVSQDPDLEQAEFSFLDFSAPEPKSDRRLTVLPGEKIARVSDQERNEMLMIFVRGFQLAKSELSNDHDSSKMQSQMVDEDDDQLLLF
ncbi:hypothetical protein [Xanthomonas rydalmerensis]|uniref:Uncharacterized protein n=1 Tax=Xanthomonas rydalmerensis TaxID=3046274 RepID=A0ABZ0JL47_9XANT|nr:hypothetical protein [Xanthomonas sp. DM-2023]WOS40524.1 hypothetical protein QN243_19365 [Xanthomonas sp. DM-2023]WOS44708.1 hypothetical protein QN242_19365 [Xanthomonas sp. DM-2023]WOS48888.1 hypothetical protein QN240_19365 [Xanthomonas sp. DM-2023]WOS53068.1 hypothetical protein QN244_19370 [Xanthomonas sp. DM-2023]WOS57252.1 hypothetical protein QN245_19365 [Xanthomonas sp. DM-2023]